MSRLARSKSRPPAMKGRAGRGACGRGAARPVGASLTAHGVYARWLARVAASPLPLRSHAQPLSQHTHLWVQGAVVGLQQHLMKPGFDRVGLACKHTPRGGGGRAAGRSGEGASEVAACDKDALQRLVPCPPRHPGGGGGGGGGARQSEPWQRGSDGGCGDVRTRPPARAPALEQQKGGPLLHRPHRYWSKR